MGGWYYLHACVQEDFVNCRFITLGLPERLLGACCNPKHTGRGK